MIFGSTGARVSYGSGTKRVQDDRTLIRYLMRHLTRHPSKCAKLSFMYECRWTYGGSGFVTNREHKRVLDEVLRSDRCCAEDCQQKRGDSNRRKINKAVPVSFTGRRRSLSASENELQRAARRTYEMRLAQASQESKPRKIYHWLHILRPIGKSTCITSFIS